ncbi:MAG: UvrD-helicase domain-containing protein [Gammaproteobacteria bacterium]|jgi:ATP-dependent helicase/nuclease subunit A
MNPTNSPTDSLTAAQPDINATVAASAGTGKTWLLVTRIIRLLLANTEPGSILALTFTRKAAAEMQMRLQERLYQMATASDNELAVLLLQTGCPDTRENRNNARELYEKVLHANFPVRLQTFHSFCQDILSHFPLEADITPGFELVENTALLQQQAWEELFAEATRDAQSKLANDLDLLMRACNGPANTRTALNSMLNHRSDWWAFTEDKKDAPAHASEQLQQQLHIDTEADPFTQFFADVSSHELLRFAELLRCHDTKTNLAHAQQLEYVLQGDTAPEDRFNRLLPVFLTAGHQPRARKPGKTQAARMGVEGETAYLDLHRRICSSMQYALELTRRMQTLDLNAVWYRTGQRYITLYQKLKRELRVLDFTDLEWSCYRLLNNADNAHWIQYKIDQRINHVLIDEFQDTNPTQWQLITPLLEEIAAGANERQRSFFIVGDEKQSIYSFRRANPQLQKQAAAYLARSMSAIEVKLDSSRRSSPAIIETVNAIFNQDDIRQYMPEFSIHSTHLQHVPGRVSLFPLQQLENEEEDPIIDSEPDKLRNPLLAPRIEQSAPARVAEAELIADQIEALIKQKLLITGKDENGDDCVRPVEFGDVMILLRNRTHIGEYESVLRNRGIPFIGSQRGSLLDNQEIQDLERLLDTLITPYNNLAIAQVLKSPIFDASDEDLGKLSCRYQDRKWYQRLPEMAAGLDDEHPLTRAARLLPHWHTLADTMPVHDLLDRIYAEGNIIQRYVSSVSPAQQQRVSANLQRFHELSLELDSGRYPSLSHFLHYLRSVRHHKDGRPDEPVAAHGQSRVSLMTIHASKGLESPVVILADCDNRGGHNNAYSALVDWPADCNRPARFQLIASNDTIDEITRGVLKDRKEAQEREELNLLYVALTRARQYLLVTGSASKNKSGWYEYIETAMKALSEPDVDGILHLATGDYDNASIAVTASPAEPPAIEIDSRLTRPVINQATTEYMIAPSVSFDASNDSNMPAHTDDGIKRGIAIHRALDLMTRVHPLSAEQTRQRIRNESGSTDDTELDSWMEEACKTVDNIEFADIFRPVDYRRALNELPVTYKQGNRSVYGLIDRLIIKDDQILLIDYKTHPVKNDTQLSSLTEAYRPQLDLYRNGVAKIWPGLEIKSGLLFTNSARLIWLGE